MSRAWTKVETILPRHPKTRHLARLWHTHPYTVCGFLLAIWDYLLEHQPDGNVNAIPDADLDELVKPCLASAIGTIPVPRDSLVTSQWVDADGYWHDWEEYAGALVSRRQKERTRKQKYRQGKKIGKQSVPRDKRGTSASRPEDVPRPESRDESLESRSSAETTSPAAPPPTSENPNAWKADAAVTLRKAGIVEREIGDALKNFWAPARLRFTDPEIAAVVLAHGRRFAAKGETWNPARVWNPRNADFDERFRWAISQQRKAEARSPTKGIRTVQQIIGGAA